MWIELVFFFEDSWVSLFSCPVRRYLLLSLGIATNTSSRTNRPVCLSWGERRPCSCVSSCRVRERVNVRRYPRWCPRVAKPRRKRSRFFSKSRGCSRLRPPGLRTDSARRPLYLSSFSSFFFLIQIPAATVAAPKTAPIAPGPSFSLLSSHQFLSPSAMVGEFSVAKVAAGVHGRERARGCDVMVAFRKKYPRFLGTPLEVRCPAFRRFPESTASRRTRRCDSRQFSAFGPETKRDFRFGILETKPETMVHQWFVHHGGFAGIPDHGRYGHGPPERAGRG